MNPCAILATLYFSSISRLIFVESDSRYAESRAKRRMAAAEASGVSVLAPHTGSSLLDNLLFRSVTMGDIAQDDGNAVDSGVLNCQAGECRKDHRHTGHQILCHCRLVVNWSGETDMVAEQLSRTLRSSRCTPDLRR